MLISIAQPIDPRIYSIESVSSNSDTGSTHSFVNDLADVRNSNQEIEITRPSTAPVFSKELIAKVQGRQLARYGEEAVRFAQAWGTDDLVTASAVYFSLMQHSLETKEIPLDPERIYFNRAQSAKSRNIDSVNKKVFNNPAAVAEIADQTILERHRSRAPGLGLDDHFFVRHGLCSKEAVYSDEPADIELLAALRRGYRAGEFDYLVNFSLTPIERSANTLLSGGINCVVHIEPHHKNLYSRNVRNCVNLAITLADVLQCGGRVHYDITSCVVGAVMVELPKNIGVSYIEE